MSTLICNAAEGLLQILLVRDNAVLCAQEWPAPTRSTEILAPALAHMLQELGMTPRDISRIACVNGPGSFTGIRLVLSTAAALRRALGASLAPLDYMQALALSASLHLQDLPSPPPTPPASGIVWVLTHARRNLVHCQPFSLPEATALAPVDLCSLEVCAHSINTLFPPTTSAQTSPALPLCVGSGLLRNQAFFHQHCPQALFGGPSYALVSQAALVHLAQHASYEQEDLNPLYVRPCDAVENLPTLSPKLGQDPAMAEQRLTALLQRPTNPDQVYR